MSDHPVACKIHCKDLFTAAAAVVVGCFWRVACQFRLDFLTECDGMVCLL